MSEPNLRERDLKVDALRGSIRGHGVDLDNARGLLAWVIEQEAWRERVDMLSGRRIEFPSFEKFVTAPAPDGLGANVDDLRRIVRGTALEVELQRALKARPNPTSNRRKVRQTSHGTTRAYTLDRLHREHPELAARVNAGELSANAAAIEAGFRKPKATIPVDSPTAAISALLRRFSRDELRAALEDRS